MYGPVTRGTWTPYMPGAIQTGPYPPGYSPEEADLPPPPRSSAPDLTSNVPTQAILQAPENPGDTRARAAADRAYLFKAVFVFVKDYFIYIAAGEEVVMYHVAKDMAWSTVVVGATHIVCGNQPFDAYVGAYSTTAVELIHDYLGGPL